MAASQSGVHLDRAAPLVGLVFRLNLAAAPILLRSTMVRIAWDLEKNQGLVTMDPVQVKSHEKHLFMKKQKEKIVKRVSKSVLKTVRKRVFCFIHLQKSSFSRGGMKKYRKRNGRPTFPPSPIWPNILVNFHSKNKSVQGWLSGESTCLPAMWPGFDYQIRRHIWVEFVLVLYSPQKPTFNLIVDFSLQCPQLALQR